MTVHRPERRFGLLIGTIGVIVLLLGAGAVMATRLPDGTTLAGTPVQRAGDAPAALAAAQERLDQTEFRFTSAVGSQVVMTGAQLGLTVDRAASRQPVNVGIPSMTAWARRLRDGAQSEPFVTHPLDSETLTGVATSISQDPVAPQVRISTGGAVATDAEEGLRTGPGQVADGLDAVLPQVRTTALEDWPAQLEVPVDGEVTAPLVTQVDVDAAVAQLAVVEQADVTITAMVPPPPAEDDVDQPELAPVDITLSAIELRSLVDVEEVAGAPEGQRLQLVSSDGGIPPRLNALMDQATLPADLQLMIENRSPTPERGEDVTDVRTITGDIVLEGAEEGFQPDVDATRAAAVRAALDGGGRVLIVGDAEAETDPAALGIVEPISTFTTFYAAGQSRVQNIRLIAELVDGTVIPAGESYEVNDAVGRRTRDNGFTDGGAILDGELVSDVGGGVSQFATTLFNAAWFAGVDLVDFKAHSFYFSRYPPGREATINFPNVDLEIRNDTPHAILIDTDSDATSITVTFWSSPYWDVQTIMGPCACGGSFEVTNQRIISTEGGAPIEESYTTVYSVPE